MLETFSVVTKGQGTHWYLGVVMRGAAKETYSVHRTPLSQQRRIEPDVLITSKGGQGMAWKETKQIMNMK